MTPSVLMRPILAGHGVPTLQDALGSALPFKIPVCTMFLVNSFPDEFCLGRCEYGSSVDSWVERVSVFPSETAVSSMNQLWINIFTTCLPGCVTLLNQHDASSRIRVRPDMTVMSNGALILKGEDKLLASEMETAKSELTDKFFPGAVCCFPLGSSSVVGITACSTTVSLHIITSNNGNFTSVVYASYAVQQLQHDRVRFIVDIFKVLRWAVTITEPTSSFHLVPNVRTRTRNGHFVTWTSAGILKELHNPHRGVVTRILSVYRAHLAHVEWGSPVTGNTQAVLVTRVGHRLQDAINKGLISKATALDHVRLGLDELHTMGLAHCDVVRENVFVMDGIAFLDDLEYLTPINRPAPLTARWSVDKNGNLSAKQLDELLYAQFVLQMQ